MNQVYEYANHNPLAYDDPTGEYGAVVLLVPGLGQAMIDATAVGIGLLMCLDEGDSIEKLCEDRLEMYMEMCAAVYRAEKRGSRPKGVGRRCESTAMERFGNCLAGRERGPLDTYNN